MEEGGGGGRDDGQKLHSLPALLLPRTLPIRQNGGYPCQTEHLQGLVETGASKEHGQVVVAVVALEGGSLHRDCGYLELGI